MVAYFWPLLDKKSRVLEDSLSFLLPYKEVAFLIYIRNPTFIEDIEFEGLKVGKYAFIIISFNRIV